jgi:hypothetical protein
MRVSAVLTVLTALNHVVAFRTNVLERKCFAASDKIVASQVRWLRGAH